MAIEDGIKHFILNNLAIRADLRDVERRHDVQLLTDASASQKERYYPQFTDRLRREAEQMADHYKIFYCLENFLRELIISKLEDEQGEKWWDTAVPDVVKKNAFDNRKGKSPAGTPLAPIF